MRKLLILFTLLFSMMMFSSTSFAEWKKLGESVDGDTFYVDFERIRKHGGYTYNWMLTDFSKPDVNGMLSSRVYQQIDCEVFRGRGLSWSYHQERMGKDENEITPEKPQWVYPPPNSAVEFVLKSVCQYAK